MKLLSMFPFLVLAGCAASRNDLRLAGLPAFDGPLCSEARLATLDEAECLRRLTAFAGRAIRSTVVVRARKASAGTEAVGAGIITDVDGRVFTAYHVVRGKTEITASARQVGGADGRLAYAELAPMPMKVKAFVERLDLALLEPVGRGRLHGHPMTIDRTVHGFAEGQEVWFFGEDSDDHQGPVITGLDETVELPGGERRVDLIRVAVPSSENDLGGPVLAPDGTVVGIMLVADETGNASYFIPVSAAVQLFGLTWLVEVTP